MHDRRFSPVLWGGGGVYVGPFHVEEPEGRSRADILGIPVPCWYEAEGRMMAQDVEMRE